jgi:5-deoxy-glucuronate isomerase
MTDNSRWVLPLGTAKRDGFDVAVLPTSKDWQHTGLYVGDLTAGERRDFEANEFEHVVVPLSGSVTVAVEGADQREIALAGRTSVFAGPTDVAYVPGGTGFSVNSDRGARLAVPFARAAKRDNAPEARHVRATEVPVELRGAGIASREVRNFGIPGVLDADSIIACEVITPSGNWSSYPPHKHDEEREGVETELEEIYYFELQQDRSATGADPGDPVGYQRVYGTDERPIDVLAEVRTGDVVLVPHGWHGPAMAPPGYDLYYLNVMAGPGQERAWLICDDPAHAWVRESWPAQQTDPRLPMGDTR